MRRIIAPLLILTIAIVCAAGYAIYISGNLKLDSALVCDENFNLLADNWKKLPGGASAGTDNDSWVSISLDSPENSLAWLYLLNGDTTLYPNAATYDRSGLLDILANFMETGDFSEFVKTTNEIIVGNERVALIYWEWDAAPNADRFENWFRELMEKARS